MSASRIAVLISGSGTNLQALIDARGEGRMAGDIVLVLCNNPEAFGLQRAAYAGIPTRVINHRDFASREDYDRVLISALEDCQADLVVLAGYMRILSPLFVRHFEGRLINIHPSLLPKYPGLHTHQRAIEADDREHGATVHFVTEELDGGPPILQGRLRIDDSDEQQLAQRVQREIEHRIYPQAVDWFVRGRLSFREQHAYLDGELIPATGIQWSNENPPT